MRTFIELNFPPASLYIQTKILSDLIHELQKNYNINAYHTFTHAFSVFQCLLHCWASSKKLAEFVSENDIFISLMAALSHDVGHS